MRSRAERMRRRIRSPPLASCRPTTSLSRQPPQMRVRKRHVPARRHSTNTRRRYDELVLREEEVVGLILVEDPVERVIRALAGLQAAVGTEASLIQRAIELGIDVTDAVHGVRWSW